MKIKRPEAKLKPYRGKKGPDIFQVLPITSQGEVLLIELKIPGIGVKYRIMEEYFPSSEVVEEKLLAFLNKMGIFSKKLKLVGKRQPFNIGNYPSDIASYVFIAKEATVITKPQLEFLVPYTLKGFSIDNLQRLVDERRIENSPLVNLNSKILLNNII